MFSQWLQSAKESANQFLSVANTVIQDTAHSLKEASDNLNQKTNAYIRDNVIKVPSDCTFVTSNIIAMGFPGSSKTRKIESNNNNREQIAQFLEIKYHDHYHIFNLTEETYDTMLFNDNVTQYNFTGYSSPTIGMIFRICIDIETFIEKSPDNIAVVHCFDGTGRTMMICAAFLRWAGWYTTTKESLALCLERRQLPLTVMLPSQLHYLDYFDNIMNGTKLSSASLTINRITISNVPDMEDGSCSAFIEIYNQNKLVYSSYRKGSKTKGIVTPVNANETLVFKLSCEVLGNVFIRCRHVPSNGNNPITLFRTQFHTGFIKLFKLELPSSELDQSISLSKEMKVEFDFLPGNISDNLNMGDTIEDQLVKESSALWNEILLRNGKEDKVNNETIMQKSASLKELVLDQSEKEEEKKEEKVEEEVHDDAMDLESMLKSYESDLNLDISAEDIDEPLDLDEFEEVLEKSINESAMETN